MSSGNPLDLNVTPEEFLAAWGALLVAKRNRTTIGVSAADRRALAQWGNFSDDFQLAVQALLRVEHVGNGSPEGEVVAPVGHRYARLDGGPGTAFYVKEAGTDANGWATITTSSTPTSGAIHRDVSLVTVTSTIAETDILNYTIPAGTMTTDGELVRFRMWADHQNIGGTRSLRMRWYVGGTLVFDSGVALGYGNNSTVWPLHVVAELVSLGASSQALYVTQIRNNNGTAPTLGLGGMNAASIASASAGDVAAASRADAINVRCTVEHAANISNIVTRRHAYTVARE